MSHTFTSYTPENIINKNANGLEMNNYLGTIIEVGENPHSYKKNNKKDHGRHAS
ncbi:MAG TPA: hypothetical protein VJ697_02185 [Nitrososphaeraceae archaeon]|nr:hypothetical protein [Nitrososphaeraceae archaeon]